jgi:trigger factor
MQISVENTGSLERKMHVEVPEEKIEGEVHNRLQSLSRTTKISGFRPGKAPLKVVQKHYGPKVRQEVIGEMVQSSFFEAITQEKLRPAGQPIIDPLKSELGQGLSYTATFEIFPEINLIPAEDLKIEKPVCPITDEDVEKMIDVLCQQRRILKKIDRIAKKEDVLIVDFEGTVEGEVFEGGEATDFRIELGSKRLIPGFEEGLLKSKSGDEVTLDLQFPDEYHQQSLAGKPVKFVVKVKEVNEQKLPELNEELFASLGVNEGGLDAFKAEVRSNMEREAENTVMNQSKIAVLNKLYEANKFELPNVLVTAESKRLQQQFNETLLAQGMKKEDIPNGDTSDFNEQASKRIAFQMIVADIAKANEIKADPTKVRQIIEKSAQSYEDQSEVINWYYSDQNRLAEIEAIALEDEVVKWVLDRAQVNEQELTFDALMNKGQTGTN